MLATFHSLLYSSQAISAYVQQDDCMLATQTVRETIEMAALMRLPSHMSKVKKLKRAEETMEVRTGAKRQRKPKVMLSHS